MTSVNEVAEILDQGSSGRAEGIERPEPEDFARIYHLHSQRVYTLCLRMARNVAEAEDLTQQVFLQAYKKLDTFPGESSFTRLLRWHIEVTTAPSAAAHAQTDARNFEAEGCIALTLYRQVAEREGLIWSSTLWQALSFL
jgi:hypothetical protein